MAIKHWPVYERPREKLLNRGSQALSDAELLAIFLRTGARGKSAVDLSRELLAHFGSLRALLAADRMRFCAAKGLGDAKYAQLQAILEIAKRHIGEELLKSDAIRSSRKIKDYINNQLRDREREVFACLWLDSQHRMLQWEEIFMGTINEASIYPREVVKSAIRHNAAAVILSHNHPSGVSQPSTSDKLITHELKETLALVGVKVLDHFIVGEGTPFSFSEAGLI